MEKNFNPLSLYRERLQKIYVLYPSKIFQSTLPIQGETDISKEFQKEVEISIHSPYTGRDHHMIHRLKCSSHFNPLSLYRERLLFYPFLSVAGDISIHSPYTGRDILRVRVNSHTLLISIHSPYTGRDLLLEYAAYGPRTFQSTLPIQGETLYEKCCII